MDPQHPNRRGERGLRAVTSSPVAPVYRPGTDARAGVDGSSQYDRFLLRAMSRDPGGADAGEPVAVAVRITRQEWLRR